MTSYINKSLYLFNDKNQIYPLTSSQQITPNTNKYFLNTYLSLDTINLSVGSNIIAKTYK